MRILLVQPPKASCTIGGEDVFIYEPLALEYVAAGVSKGHEVRIVDLRLESNFNSVLQEFRPDIVGITAYTVHVNVAKALFQQVKKENPKALTVVGGHHASIMPEDFTSPDIDLVVIGEGVTPFREIVERYTKGESLEAIPGTTHATGHAMKSTVQEDLDDLPFPDRKLTARYRKYYYSEWMKPLASIRTSKGCPHRCSFCAQWKIANGQYYRRKPERIVEELAGIVEDYVFFADDESLVDAARMGRLADLIKEAGVNKRYFLYGRSDTIARNPELLQRWRDIGLERVFIGLEFFRDSDLNAIKKGSTLIDNEKAVRILQNLGIDVYASFIVHPEFSKADFALFEKYSRSLNLDFASFAVLTPLPGTDLYEEVEEKLITRNYDYFDFIHTLLPTNLPLREFYAQYKHLFMNAVSLSNQISNLRKYQLKDVVGIIIRARRFYNRLGTAHLDYSQRNIASK